jgi:hypothetical protein
MTLSDGRYLASPATNAPLGARPSHLLGRLDRRSRRAEPRKKARVGLKEGWSPGCEMTSQRRRSRGAVNHGATRQPWPGAAVAPLRLEPATSLPMARTDKPSSTAPSSCWHDLGCCDWATY